ncbi:S-methyl-5'-thioadenosine phosphorylase [Synechococcus sp. PCC 7336]|uniref:S-methyl-5'-thioadenosine phosphorylase n=1 Tax=Synechococcus sp. PCC 7336 TaxID=195250 RepID=UPI00034A86C4|nr:S-methyl-5'-thioadenosine phosphorylase [Synechococcus sp. PCC 7336]
MTTLPIEPTPIAIVGGSGLYRMQDLKDIEEVALLTPFGEPSDSIRIGTLAGSRVAFLARHGRTHSLLPSEIPFRANIYALKQLGVKYLISASAVGSLQAAIAPLDMVIPTQFIDRTKHRTDTFFGQGVVAHISFADPVCAALADVVYEAAEAVSPSAIAVHRGGSYVCIEGPAFSTQAESLLYKSWNAAVIGMTNVTEAKLAREAEIAYATLALVTDFDCWHPDREAVTVEMVIENLHENAANAQMVVREVVRRLSESPPVSQAHDALKFSILTDLSQISSESANQLEAILVRYMPPTS